MNIFDKLSAQDQEIIESYLREYSYGAGEVLKNGLKDFLRYWSENKQIFYRAFDENLILKKEISFQITASQIAKKLQDALYNDRLIAQFINNYKNKVNHISAICDSPELRWDLSDFVYSDTMLVDNIYNGPEFSIPGNCTVNGKPFVIKNGCKVIKTLGKIVEAIGCDQIYRVCKKCRISITKIDSCCPCCGNEKIVEISGYDLFREAHAQALTDKKARGTLCLSIHPMDFITMSDNNNGWDSCMSWMKEDGPGDYRLGTIEMMNSDCVIMAYIEDKNDMSINYVGSWNSKRWRQLIIVTEDLILGNRQYPYTNSSIEDITLSWVRELFNNKYGYGPYPEEKESLFNNRVNQIKDSSISLDITSNYMYNDVYDDRNGYINIDRINNHYYLNFSGPAVCTCCGENMTETQAVCSANQVQCVHCGGSWKCSCCDEWYDSFHQSNFVDEEELCDYCFESYTILCECCGEVHLQDNMRNVYIKVNDVPNSDDNLRHSICLCKDCFNNPKSYINDYGELTEVTVKYIAHDWPAFNIDNISYAALMRSSLSMDVVEMLLRIQEADSEERKELLKEYF